MHKIKCWIIVGLCTTIVILFTMCINTFDAITQQYADRLHQHTIETDARIAEINKMFSEPVRDPSEQQISAFNSTTWTRRYSKSGSRDVRYGTTSIKFSTDKKYTMWRGKKRISSSDMTKITKNVFKQLPHIRTTDANVALIVETAIAESSGGYYIDEGTGDLGILQIRVNTATDLLKWLSVTHPDIRSSILAFRNDKLSMRDNLKHNIPFSIAVAITEYWRKAGPDYHHHISSVTDRGIMWTSVYNTSKGKGTVNKYIARVQQYNRHLSVSR